MPRTYRPEDIVIRSVDSFIRSVDYGDMNDSLPYHPRRWAAPIPLLFVVFMDMVDSQIVAVALPSIRTATGASGSALEWIAAGGTLTFAPLLITGDGSVTAMAARRCC